VTNRLLASMSPYLQQHAHNPVDWYPWCDEAFDKARQQDKPVLVSIGYSACHWCHVMAHESFEDADVAELMNHHFVNIKVDREERPDVDSVYMDAVQALTGHGGWPLNVFVTPEREPFFAGTYFPAAPRHGLPSWTQVLRSLSEAWHNERESITRTATQLIGHIAARTMQSSGDEPSPDILDSAFHATQAQYDDMHGGFGRGPKFPNALNLSFVLRYWARTGTPEALAIVRHSLDSMAAGGIYDHVGGGFHRYTVDRGWSVPHFEKMLYDNALLARLYVEAWQACRDPLYRSIAEGVLDYLLRDMTAEDGLFYSSEDADSEGEEGRFYVWTRDQLREVLGDDADEFGRCMGVTAAGNFEGSNILSLNRTIQDTGTDRVPEQLVRLRRHREGRVRPTRDAKVLTDWDALTISAFTAAGTAFGRPDYVEAGIRAATRLFDFAWDHTLAPRSGRLSHAGGTGPNRIPGFLSDYANLAEAGLTLFEATGDELWLERATLLAQEFRLLFPDNHGGFFMSPTLLSDDLPLRPREVTDGVTPSGYSAAVTTLLRLSRIVTNDEFEAQAIDALVAVGPALGPHALSFGHLLCALELALSPQREIIVVRPTSHAEPLGDYVLAAYLPNVTRVVTTDAAIANAGVPLTRGKASLGDMATAYVCDRFECGRPITNLLELQQTIAPLLPALGRD
jgi:uncharacterized protein YyaL (SSP411 family)